MYPYSPLAETTNEIRLLSLQPGNFNDDIYCKLSHAELDQNLRFTALSYTWGDPNVQKAIVVDGHALDVTINLYDALQHMRHPTEWRTFWIDAVCINQADLGERSRQVLRMRDIYSLATTVEVWLGKADGDDDAAAMELIGRLGALVPDAEEQLTQGSDAKSQEVFAEEFEKCTPGVARALAHIFKRPWWLRVWIVQELSLAKQDMARVRCGGMVLPWLYFLITAYAIESSWFIIDSIISSGFPDERLDAFMQGIRMAQCRRTTPAGPCFTLLELLNQHRDCEATDPRDKVFGLLGLSGDVDNIGIKPDYTISPQETYTDLFKKHVAATRSLDMICAGRHPRNFNDLPSWVPDWSTDQLIPGICIHDRYVGGNSVPGSPIPHFEKYMAAGDSSPQVSFFDNNISVAAVHVGNVVLVSEVDDGMAFEDIETFGRADENGKSGSDSKIFNHWLNMILDDGPIWDEVAKRYGVENVLDTFCRTLIGNRNNRMMEPPQNYDSENDSESGGSDIMDDQEQEQSISGQGEADSNEDPVKGSASEEDDGDDEEALFSPPDMLSMTLDGFRACLQVSWGKRLAILDSGHIVVVVLGCSMPLVLRPIDASRVNFIGESYFHGIMKGELMEKPDVKTLVME
ncbi:heterokaryon incompatibility protein-domain-containing protein [Bisporella sp. PMI_857]|nr:heterokaryon incompatibility protein-domain-containing protein [Bisporella sp. PMI_857]